MTEPSDELATEAPLPTREPPTEKPRSAADAVEGIARTATTSAHRIRSKARRYHPRRLRCTIFRIVESGPRGDGEQVLHLEPGAILRAEVHLVAERIERG